MGGQLGSHALDLREREGVGAVSGCGEREGGKGRDAPRSRDGRDRRSADGFGPLRRLARTYGRLLILRLWE